MKCLLLLLVLLLPRVSMAEEPDDKANKALDYFVQGQTDAMMDYIFQQGTFGQTTQSPINADVLKMKIEAQKYRGVGKYVFREKVLEQIISPHLVRQVWLVGFVGSYARVEFFFYKPMDHWVFQTFNFSNGSPANAKLIEDFQQPGYRRPDEGKLSHP